MKTMFQWHMVALTCSTLPLVSTTLVLRITRPTSIRTTPILLYHQWKPRIRYFSSSISRSLTSSSIVHSQQPPSPRSKFQTTIRENIYTLPNILTVSRILVCPVLGWSIVEPKSKENGKEFTKTSSYRSHVYPRELPIRRLRRSCGAA